MGWNGQLAMNIVGAFMFFLNTAITLQAASRLVYAIARDGVLPFSKQIRRVNKNKQPYVALAITTVVAWIICCTILPSSVAFESITSASVIAIIASYGVVIFGRTFITFKTFKQAEWNLGRFSYPIGVVSLIWIGFIFIVLCLPSTYPVEVDKFNFSPLILLIILVFVFVWWFASARRWFKGPVPDIKLEDR